MNPVISYTKSCVHPIRSNDDASSHRVEKLKFRSAKMKGPKTLLANEKLNTSAINLQLTAQSQGFLRGVRPVGLVVWTGPHQGNVQEKIDLHKVNVHTIIIHQGYSRNSYMIDMWWFSQWYCMSILYLLHYFWDSPNILFVYL